MQKNAELAMNYSVTQNTFFAYGIKCWNVKKKITKHQNSVLVIFYKLLLFFLHLKIFTVYL